MAKLVWVGLVSMVVVLPQAKAEDSTRLEQLAKWLSGDFSNYQQSLEYPEQGISPTLQRVEKMASHDEDVVVLRNTQSSLFTPEQPVRYQFYELEQTRRGIRQTVFNADDADASRDSWQQLYGCRIDWTWRDDHFVGERDSQRCYFYLPENGQRVGLEGHLRLDALQWVVNDQALLEDGTLLLGPATQTTHHYQRTTFYDYSIEHRISGTQDWQTVELSADLMDQGMRYGMRVVDAELELRYQLELLRDGDEVSLRVFHTNRTAPILQTEKPLDKGALEVEVGSLRIQIRPRTNSD